MLYETWRDLASRRRGETALRDLASGRRWSFAELFAAGEDRSAGAAPGLVCARGHNPEFILDVLAAWRTHRVLLPLESDQNPPQVEPPPPHCVHLKTTSGTGGSPRLVAFTAAQLAADSANIVATMGLRPDWPNLGVISMAHSYGFSNLVLPLLLHGIPLVLAPGPLPEMVRQASAGLPALTLPAVPAMWRAWHEADAISAHTRLAISAGAPLALGLEQSVFDSHGLKIHNFVGSTECGGIAYDGGEAPRADAAVAGRALRNVRLSVDAEGCLMVRSQAVGETYWPVAEESLRDGVFATSDLAEIQDDVVLLRGRRDDQINLAGRKLPPEIVERVLLQHPEVRECLVFGVPSPDSGRADMIVAVVSTEAGEPELRRFALERLPAWQVPRIWKIVSALPVNARGKLSRSEWRQKYRDESAG